MEKEILSCRKLWQAVLIRLIEDLFPNLHCKNQIKRRIAIKLKLEANDYLLKEQKELKIVCEYANFNYETVLNSIKKLKDRYDLNKTDFLNLNKINAMGVNFDEDARKKFF